MPPRYELPDPRYKGWYSVGGYALYPDGIEFNREGPPVIPTFPITNLYEGCGLPVPPLLEEGLPDINLNENILLAPPFDKQEKNLPRYGRQKWVKPFRKSDVYTGYDNDGLPIFPDGSGQYNKHKTYACKQIFGHKIQQIQLSKPQFTNKMPKKPDKNRSYKTKKNKNPPPKKVDMDQMFREENDRLKRMKEFE